MQRKKEYTVVCSNILLQRLFALSMARQTFREHYSWILIDTIGTPFFFGYYSLPWARHCLIDRNWCPMDVKKIYLFIYLIYPLASFVMESDFEEKLRATTKIKIYSKKKCLRYKSNL